MSLDFLSENRAAPDGPSSRAGSSIDALLQRLLSDTGELRAGTTSGEARELTVRHLEVRGPLHRRDIYDDVR